MRNCKGGDSINGRSGAPRLEELRLNWINFIPNTDESRLLSMNICSLGERLNFSFDRLQQLIGSKPRGFYIPNEGSRIPAEAMGKAEN